MEQQPNSVVASGVETVVVVPAIAVDVALGIVAKTWSAVALAGRPVRSVGRPLTQVIIRPPLVPAPLQLGTWLDRAARRGAVYRGDMRGEVEDLLDRLIPAIVSDLLQHIDITALLKQNVDVATLAEEVIADIDLPAIIRDSTAAVASDTILGVRMQSISGDEAIGRAMDRFRLRFGRRGTATRPAASPS